MRNIVFNVLLGVAIFSVSSAKLREGEQAPNFTLTEVGTGDSVSLSDYRGQVVVLQMWKVCSGSCGGVVELMKRVDNELLTELYPNLPEIQAEYGSLLKVLGVNVINKRKHVLAKVREDDIAYPVFLGRNSGIARDYQLVTLPMVFIIDKDGLVRFQSAYPKYEELKKVIASLLKDITGKQ